MTKTADLRDFRQQVRALLQNVIVFIEHRRTDPHLDQSCPRKFKNQSHRVVIGRKRRQLQDTSVKEDSKGKVWPGAKRASAAASRQKPSLPARSLSCRDFHGARAPVPETG